jgi:hypothetical protein
MASCITSAFCCNPFNESGHNVRNNLRNILHWMTRILLSDKCHKKISKLKCAAPNKQKDDDSNKIEEFAKMTAMQSLNDCLQLIGESPTHQKEKKLGNGKYPTRKINRTEKAVKTRILNISENVNSSAVCPSPDAEILKQLKG